MRWTMAAAFLAMSCGGANPAAPDGSTVDAPADAPADAAVDAPGCAMPARPLPSTQQVPWVLAIGADGTTYAAIDVPGQRLDRWRPDQSGFDSNWLTLTPGQWLWALALDDAGTLYVGAGDGLWAVDTRTAPPRATLLDPGQTRALTIGPGGEPYYTSDAANGQRVYRWSGGAAHEVSTAGFGEPSDLLFDTDGSLLLSDLLTGLHRITLDDQHHQTGAERVLDPGQERINAIARDADGVYYLGLTFQDGVRRYGPGFTAPVSVLAEKPIRDLVFARGWLGCSALFATHTGGVIGLAISGPGAP